MGTVFSNVRCGGQRATSRKPSQNEQCETPGSSALDSHDSPGDSRLMSTTTASRSRRSHAILPLLGFLLTLCASLGLSACNNLAAGVGMQCAPSVPDGGPLSVSAAATCPSNYCAIDQDGGPSYCS